MYTNFGLNKQQNFLTAVVEMVGKPIKKKGVSKPTPLSFGFTA